LPKLKKIEIKKMRIEFDKKKNKHKEDEIVKKNKNELKQNK
jgi:hypothetical protein